MKITFIVPGIGLGGGNRVVFEYANRLQERGHEVSVVYPLIPLRSGARWYNVRRLAIQILGPFVNLMRGNAIKWFNLNANLLRVPTLWERFIPDADIVVATWWATAYYVNSYGENKGQKFYLVQHYETWGGPEEKVNRTYKMKLDKIVIAGWLKNLIEDEFNEQVAALIPNGINFQRVHLENGRAYYGNKRVLMPYSRVKWKGVEDGLKAWAIIKKEITEAKLVMFGTHKGRDVPDYVEFHQLPSGDELRKVYNSCDLFLFPSRAEGLPAPPMEAMACGCALVATDIDGVSDFAIHLETALLSPPYEPEALAQNAIALLKDEARLRSIAQKGHQYIQKFTWEKATEQLEKVFEASKSINK